MSRRRSKRPDPPQAKQAQVRRTAASPRRRLALWAGVGSLLLAALAYRQYAMAPARWLRQAEEAAARGDWPVARQLAEQASRRWEHSAAARLTAARAATELGETSVAVRYYAEAVARLAPDEQLPTLLAEARALLKARRAAAAEVCLRGVLEVQPDNVEALAALSGSLLAVGRRWEAVPSMLRLAQLDAAQIPILAALGSPGILVMPPDYVRQILAAEPNYAAHQTALAERALAAGDARRAAEILEEAFASSARPAAAEVLHARCLIALQQWDEFARRQPAWSAVEDYPMLWFARAEWAEANGQASAAARCFWESLRREPLYLTSNHRLAMHLRALGRTDEAAQFEAFAARVRLFVAASNEAVERPAGVGKLFEAAELLEACGFLWEARAWCGHVLRLAPAHAGAQEMRARMEAALTEGAPRALAQRVPALSLDLSDLPLPNYARRPSPAPAVAEDSAEIAFHDVAPAVGLEFRYFNAPDPSTAAWRMFESTGGGVGALDYDLDGWPDLYFTQGCRWPPQPGQREHLDRLFRSDAGRRVVDVTTAAGLQEEGFSQGLAHGDFNSDGLPDVLVANIGSPKLFVNLGDGTFQAAALPPQREALVWNSSALMADLNGDSLADLYLAAYLAGEDVYDRVCGESACSPTLFPPAADQAYLNAGDGGFLDVGQAAGLSPADGPGLGVIGLPSAVPGRLDLFVANDEAANALLVHTAAGPTEVRWTDAALAAGIAFDEAGNPQACMGIAADDADGDGRLDLFVTNFYHESNTLYQQTGDGLFVDATRAFELREPSWDLLGFGTQFLDADLDGWPDLAVVNGYIEDQSRAGVPFRMRPQFFRNEGGLRFTELLGERAGDYFQQEYLGRGLARLDFNRDGREDFAVSQIEGPAHLVLNVAPRKNHALLLRLRGVRSQRDAYGAQLVVRVGQRTLHRWLIPGGYFCSHEPQFVVGLGTAEQADEVQLTWPSGERQTWQALAADTPWLVREGGAQILALPHDVLAAD